MSGMLKVTTKWTGFSGAPGYTNFYFRDFTANNEPTSAQATAAVARVQTFWSNMAAKFPPPVRLAIQGDVQVIEDTDGKLKDIFTVTPPADIVGGSATAEYSSPTGMVIHWRTGGVRNGRRVRGRTFLVPCANNMYQSDGSIATASLASAVSTAQALADSTTGSPDLGVWARPTAPGATDGAWWLVTGVTVPDLAAVLRSRRN
jgi:hypothetical protein